MQLRPQSKQCPAILGTSESKSLIAVLISMSILYVRRLQKWLLQKPNLLYYTGFRVRA